MILEPHQKYNFQIKGYTFPSLCPNWITSEDRVVSEYGTQKSANCATSRITKEFSKERLRGRELLGKKRSWLRRQNWDWNMKNKKLFLNLRVV